MCFGIAIQAVPERFASEIWSHPLVYLTAVSFPRCRRRCVLLCQQPFVGDGLEGVECGIFLGATVRSWIEAVRQRRRAESRLSRARAKDTPWYAPRVSSFSTPPRLYRKRHRRPPAEVTSRKSPRWSNSLYGFRAGFAGVENGPGRIRTYDQGIHFVPGVSARSGLSLHPRHGPPCRNRNVWVRDARACH